MISISGLDGLMNGSWRARSEVDVDGWIVRLSGGVTQRANSVLPVATPRDVGKAITRVEQLYADHGVPPSFQISPAARPVGLDHLLADRGYELRSPTRVQVAAIEDVMRRLPPSSSDVTVRDEPSQDWLRLWWAVDGRGDAHAQVIARNILTAGPALYASTRDKSGTTAVGRLTLMGRWSGIYCMAVRPDVRRRGHARNILRALLEHAADRDVRHAWLQVVADNHAARTLYRRIGFADFSDYHYRVLHPPLVGVPASRSFTLSQRLCRSSGNRACARASRRDPGA